jgi:hypothetical protein
MKQAQDTPLVELPEHLGPTPPWMPPDAVVDRWAPFAREATTTAALTATGHAFAAPGLERTALHCHTLARPEQQRLRVWMIAHHLLLEQAAHSQEDGETGLCTNREGVLS